MLHILLITYNGCSTYPLINFRLLTTVWKRFFEQLIGGETISSLCVSRDHKNLSFLPTLDQTTSIHVTFQFLKTHFALFLYLCCLTNWQPIDYVKQRHVWKAAST